MNLEIRDLNVSTGSKTIIKNFSHTFTSGKIYALIGPNGQGKSTLLAALMADYKYQTTGEIFYNNINISKQNTSERAQNGFYILMQNPIAIKGVKLLDLIHSAKTNLLKKELSILDTYAEALAVAKELNIDESFLDREVNVGFSGGERKKAEFLQMKMLDPQVILLDEIDSGLDVDSINNIASAISKIKKANKIIIVVSHYKMFLEKIKPDEVLILKGGQVAEIGNYSRLMSVLSKGFGNE